MLNQLTAMPVTKSRSYQSANNGRPTEHPLLAVLKQVKLPDLLPTSAKYSSAVAVVGSNTVNIRSPG